MMKRFNIAFLLFVLLVFASCAAKKRAAEFEAQPAWMKQKPNIEGHFVGVGSAKKVGTRAEYIEKSKQDALADLAGEVSVQISASSVLHTIETQYGNTDFFDQRIEIATDDYLEGFEAVDTYENEENYWVYYRISKKTYYEAKAKRKEEAIANAKAKFIAGQDAQLDLNPKEAITFYLQGLSAIKQYMAEETPTQLDGQKTDIGNKLYLALNDVFMSLSIKPVLGEVHTVRGEKPDRPMQFTVFYKNEPVKGIPVSFSYSGGYLNNNISFTNDVGQVSVNSGNIHSRNEQEQLFASVDMSVIAIKATDDLFIRGLNTHLKQETASIKINITLPKFAISIEEDFCKTSDCESIIRMFEKNVLNSGYLLDTLDVADYVFDIHLNYVNGESAGAMTSVYLRGNIKLLNTKTDLVWAKSISKIKGVGRSREEAKKEAFATLLKNFKLIYFRQGLAAIN